MVEVVKRVLLGSSVVARVTPGVFVICIVLGGLRSIAPVLVLERTIDLVKTPSLQHQGQNDLVRREWAAV